MVEEHPNGKACCPDAGEPGCHGQAEPCQCIVCRGVRKPYRPHAEDRDSKRAAYRIVAALIDVELTHADRHLPEILVQLGRIRDAMLTAGLNG